MSHECKLKILIVDDDKDSLAGLEFSLITFGYTVKSFYNPVLALEEYKQEKYDVVISDYKMPQMNGLELLDGLREYDRTARVILMTGYGTLHMAKDALNKKAAHFLTKPINIDELFGYLDGICAELKKPVAAVESPVEFGKGAEQAEVDSLAAQPGFREGACKSVLQGKKIILVEDNLEITGTLVLYLNKKGYVVQAVTTGQQALKELRSGRYDLCLLDINLPDISGLNIIEKIRDSGRKMISCIVLSGNVNNDMRLRCLELGISEVLAKPFSLAELSQIMERMLMYRYQNFITPAEVVDITNNQVLTGMNSLISALEVRDNYTRGHSETVANIVASVLTYHNFSPTVITRAYIGARLHDIGKIGIKDNVLLKTTALTKKEYNHVRQHPVIGTHIVNGLPGMESLIPIILMHHERFDGTGYPFGLGGKEIPFLARVTAVADTYDAITSERSYRKKRSPEQALDIIRDVQGRQLCPEAAGLFSDWITQSKLHHQAAGR